MKAPMDWENSVTRMFTASFLLRTVYIELVDYFFFVKWLHWQRWLNNYYLGSKLFHWSIMYFSNFSVLVIMKYHRFMFLIIIILKMFATDVPQMYLLAYSVGYSISTAGHIYFLSWVSLHITGKNFYIVFPIRSLNISMFSNYVAW